jgi:hypothetical protein
MRYLTLRAQIGAQLQAIFSDIANRRQAASRKYSAIEHEFNGNFEHPARVGCLPERGPRVQPLPIAARTWRLVWAALVSRLLQSHVQLAKDIF